MNVKDCSVIESGGCFVLSTGNTGIELKFPGLGQINHSNHTPLALL